MQAQYPASDGQPQASPRARDVAAPGQTIAVEQARQYQRIDTVAGIGHTHAYA